MPSFAYQAVDNRGARKRGTLDAASSRAAAAALESSGLFVVDIANAPVVARQRGGSERGAVLELTRAMASLLTAGMPLAKALDAAKLAVPARLTDVVDQIRREVERGASLSAALMTHSHLFSPLYTGVVRAAEKSGDLAEGFEELSTTLERQHELREKLISLSIY